MESDAQHKKEIPMSEVPEMRAKSAVPLPSLAEVNDLGKPWRYEEDGCTVTRISPWSAPGCHPVGCGLKIYTDANGKITKVEGDENHPVTQGRLCVRCITLKDYLYNPSRLLYPLRRDPKYRGQADKWERVSWDEAIATIKANYDRITKEYGRESCVCFTGTGREGGTFNPYGSVMLGTPNYCYTQSGYACYIPRLAASSYILGAAYPEIDYACALPGRYDDPEFELPECLIIWGKMPLASNGDGLFGHAVVDMIKRGSRLITVDPRMNWLSSRADIHLRLRSGTDAALAMGMLNVIINEDLYDHEFVEYWCYGFEELKARINDPEKGMTVEQAAEITGISAEQIRKASRLYAQAKPAGISWGLAIDQKANGMQAGQAILALMSITGNIDVPGGNILGDATTGLNEVGFGFERGVGQLAQKMIGLTDYPAYCNLIMNAHADLMLRAMETGEPYPIKFGFYGGNNLMACTSAEPKRWHDAIIKSLEFCFSIETFMTPSAQASCDVVLPLAASAESDGTTFTHYGASMGIKGFRHECTRTGEALSDAEACFKIGKALNPVWWEDYNTVKDFINHLRLSKKYDFDEVSQEVYVGDEVLYRKNEIGRLRGDGKVGFNTPTGRIELFSNIFYQFGDDPLPYYDEPQYSPVRTPELLHEYPYVLTTGARTYAFFHSENRQIPFCRELNPDPLVEVHPKTAHKLGIGEGQWCEVSNQFGSAKLKAKITETVSEDTIHAQHGWWFPEQEASEPNLYGTFRSQINNLVPNFHFGKLGFGAPFKCLLANIKPIDENLDTDMNEVWSKFKREDQ
jgi:anaerobic selenocysteine-containing dehydrogenase